MAKKKPKTPKKPELVRKQIIIPEQWAERIDAARGEVPFSDFVREAILDKIGREGLVVMPQWGQGRPRKSE